MGLSAACGGGNDEDPQQVLEATFAGDASVDSGAFELSLNIDAEGGIDPGSSSLSADGSFQGGEDGAPELDLSAEIEGDDGTQEFGLTSTGDAGYVNFMGTDYELPPEVYSRFQQGFEQSPGDGANALLGIDPTGWLTDLSNEGTEDVDGTETVHISGQADVPDLVEDLKTLAQRVPDAAQQLGPAEIGLLDQLTALIESVDVDVYSGVDDDILRKFEASMVIDPPDLLGGAAESVEIDLALELSQVNEPQTIAAPSGAQPLSTLLDQLGIDPSQLGAFEAFGTGAAGGPGGGGSAASGNSAAVLDCIAEAQDAAALEQCEALTEQ